jgi:ribosome maturation factor RimP
MIEKEAIANIIEAYLKDSANYLVDITIAPGNVISIEIDNDENVNIDDCVALSRYLESQLDRETEDFELTVASAGLTFPFKTLRQYKKYEGQTVEVLSKGGQKLSGVLKSSDDDGFTISITKKVKLDGAKRKTEVEEDIRFAYEDVKYTKYVIQFK